MIRFNLFLTLFFCSFFLSFQTLTFVTDPSPPCLRHCPRSGNDNRPHYKQRVPYRLLFPGRNPETTTHTAPCQS